MLCVGAGVKQKAQWGKFTDSGRLIQNSGFNVLARMPGACPNSLLGCLKPGLNNGL